MFVSLLVLASLMEMLLQKYISMSKFYDSHSLVKAAS